jgi:8-oxo-dGTP diphosphatase/2-hydroxy-dATP diphosphatase
MGFIVSAVLNHFFVYSREVLKRDQFIFLMRVKNQNAVDYHFAGIDVGGLKKGYHLCLMSDHGSILDLVRLKTPESVSRYLKERDPSCIAIDGPAASVRTGVQTREAEQQLHRLGYRIQWTPRKEGRAQEWMQQSAELWSVLRRDFPQIPIAETFPTAIHDRILTEDVQIPLNMLQSSLLREHRADFFDAILAAVAARCIFRKEAEVFGANDEIGPVFLPAKPYRHYTLTLILDGNRILLGRKKRGFGEGYWNGFGGKVEAGETVAGSAIREIFEEVGLKVKFSDLIPAGLLFFRFAGSRSDSICGTVFRVESFQGEPAESEEMIPQWFDIGEIPYDQMWPDDRFWFPLMLERRSFVATFHFGVDQSIEHRTLVESDSAFSMIQRGKSRRPVESI